MTALVIKLPDFIYKVLKTRAKSNHRSMTHEVIATLARCTKLGKMPDSPRWNDWATQGEFQSHPEPMKLRFKVTDASFNAAKRMGSRN